MNPTTTQTPSITTALFGSYTCKPCASYLHNGSDHAPVVVKRVEETCECSDYCRCCRGTADYRVSDHGVERVACSPCAGSCFGTDLEAIDDDEDY